MGNGNEATRTAPDSFLLVRFGKNNYTKDGKEDSFEFNDALADLIITEFNTRARDGVIDYEHQTLSGGVAPAAGWINRLEKTAEGLTAHVKYWTDKGKEHLEKGEYRYFSPTLIFSAGKSPAALHSVALTNHPALHGVEALVANDTITKNSPGSGKNKEVKMTIKTELALRKLFGDTALALSDTTDEAVARRIEALADELPGLRDKARRCGELETAAESQKKELLLSDAIAKNKITNGAKEAYAKLSLVQLEDILSKTPEDGSGVPKEKLPPVGGTGKKPVLTAEEKEIARRMNLTEEEYVAAKKAAGEDED